ncbi:Ankyrin repeat family protein [Trifolium repens]|nr:Ankyrin repeat family protein [Trifolium repens]
MASAELSPLMSFDHVTASMTEFARAFNHNYYQPLHLAILKGDWESTKAFFDNDPSALTAKITIFGGTALHAAALGSQWKLVEKLVQHMPANMVVELGFTCLHYVAYGESVDAAKALVAKNSSITQVTDSNGFTPLIYSITSTICKEMVWYLVLNTTDDRPACPFSGPSASQLVTLLTAAGFHDITLYILERYPNLATVVSDSKGSTILNVLSMLPSHFQSGHNIGFWKRCIYHCVPVELEYGNTIWNALQTLVPGIKLVRDAKLRHVSSVRLVEFLCSQASAKNDCQFWQSFVSADIILRATSSGIVEILRICFLFFPDLIWSHIPNEGYVAQIAISNRQEKVFSLLCKKPTICKMQVLTLDESKYATSHLAATRFASQVDLIPGAAFQMQRELQWFKEVEKLDHPLHKEVKNQDGKTPWEVFKEEHKELLEEGKNWMKDTSNSCMLVATLIATIAFAAAITVPGGNNQDKGIPIFLSDNTFMVFVVSDALALFSSMASLLMFLAILNARFAEEDFVMALPEKLIIGLACLFLAIVNTMVAFGAALSILVQERLKWAPIPIALLACVPIALFAMLQLPLFIEMIISTYGSRFSQ